MHTFLYIDLYTSSFTHRSLPATLHIRLYLLHIHLYLIHIHLYLFRSSPSLCIYLSTHRSYIGQAMVTTVLHLQIWVLHLQILSPLSWAYAVHPRPSMSISFFTQPGRTLFILIRIALVHGKPFPDRFRVEVSCMQGVVSCPASGQSSCAQLSVVQHQGSSLCIRHSAFVLSSQSSCAQFSFLFC